MADDNTNMENQLDTNPIAKMIMVNRTRMSWFFAVTSFVMYMLAVFWIGYDHATAFDSITGNYYFLAGGVILSWMGAGVATTFLTSWRKPDNGGK